MKTLAPLQIRVERFGRWHLLLGLFSAAALLAAGWTVWVWRDTDSLNLMAAFAAAIFLAILSAQYPYWIIRPFTLFTISEAGNCSEATVWRMCSRCGAWCCPDCCWCWG